jgi:hypothetical protein
VSLTDQFAPLPENGQDVTAASIVRFEAVRALELTEETRRLAREVFGPCRDVFELAEATAGEAADRYVEKAREANSAFVIVLLLEALTEHAPERVEPIARRVWQYRRGRDDVRETLWVLLTRAGVDVPALLDAERQQAEQATGRRAA